MITPIRLQKSSFRHQEKDGWCGPAALQMVLLNSGINLTQREIAKKTFDPNWGTPHENMYSFAKSYFSGVNLYTQMTLRELSEQIKKGRMVIANIVSQENDPDSGHYINIASIDLDSGKMLVFDPDSEGGIKEIETSWFEKQWFDYATEHDVLHKIKTERWAIVIDQNTRKNPTP